MYYVYWIFMWTIFGAIMGAGGWHNPEVGALVGFVFSALTSIIYFAVDEDMDQNEDPIEAAIDALTD